VSACSPMLKTRGESICSLQQYFPTLRDNSILTCAEKVNASKVHRTTGNQKDNKLAKSTNVYVVHQTSKVLQFIDLCHCPARAINDTDCNAGRYQAFLCRKLQKPSIASPEPLYTPTVMLVTCFGNGNQDVRHKS